MDFTVDNKVRLSLIATGFANKEDVANCEKTMQIEKQEIVRRLVTYS